MYKNKVSRIAARQNETGNAVIVVLVVLMVVAVGALSYMSGQKAGEASKGKAASSSSIEPVMAEMAAPSDAPQRPEIVIEPGNPVVARFSGEDIKRLDVFNYIQTLSPEVRQMPIEQLFSAALNQMLNDRAITKKVKNVNLDKDPEVKKQLALAKEQIVRSVYIQNEVSDRVTDERLKQAYEAYVLSFPKVEEVKAAHILIKDKKEAEDVLKKLKEGGDFVALAKEHSIDGTKDKGGDLGYFLKSDVVPEFGDAAFSTEAGTMTQELVKSQFGYHIIKVEEKRMRPPASFEEAKPFLDAQLRRLFLAEVIKGLRSSAKVESFDINGKVIEPIVAEEAPVEGASEKK